ncbi:hypothetical protein ACH49M_21325 [Rhodococcus qingshengii]|uniref:hypothetical protein n=1 Tax=Rhodococcus qingshengii TaxID=334542 RepID=UPI003701C8D7
MSDAENNDSINDVEPDDVETDDLNDEVDTPDLDDVDKESAEDDKGDDKDKPLGPKGEKALAAIKDKHKVERQARLAAERENRELKARLDGDEDAEVRIRREADDAATAKANAKIIKAELRAAASGKLADPSDAVAFITDLEQFDVDDDGDVDAESLADAIDELLQRKPHLAAQSGAPKTPKPDRSQGARGQGSRSVEQQFSDAMQTLL